jgi:hypothetical protein
MAFETWGTFSVADHLADRAFVADVLLYDRLLVPVPDDRERKRWERLGRAPEVLDRKLTILEEPSRGKPRESLVQRLDWSESYRTYLDNKFREQRAATRQAEVDRALADAIDREIVAYDVRAGEPKTPEIVPAYGSYTAMQKDFAPVAVAGVPGLKPDDRHVGVISWEFFVPDDSTLDDDGLLAQAVEMVQNKDFRDARAAFHKWRRELPAGASPKQVRSEFETTLGRYQEQTARTKVRTRTLNAVMFVGLTAGFVGAVALGPAGIAASALGLARFGVEKGWRAPAEVPDARAVAMFHDARKHFGWDMSSSREQ